MSEAISRVLSVPLDLPEVDDEPEPELAQLAPELDDEEDGEEDERLRLDAPFLLPLEVSGSMPYLRYDLFKSQELRRTGLPCKRPDMLHF